MVQRPTLTSVLDAINGIPSTARSGTFQVGSPISLSTSVGVVPALLGTISFRDDAHDASVVSDLQAILVAKPETPDQKNASYSLRLIAPYWKPQAAAQPPHELGLGATLSTPTHNQAVDWADCSMEEIAAGHGLKQSALNFLTKYQATPANFVIPGAVNAGTAADWPGETIVLSRGVGHDSPSDYAYAQQGNVYPKDPNGNRTALQHSKNSDGSQMTSWTSNPLIARVFALQAGKGVVLKAEFPKECVTKNLYNGLESEYLISGSVQGATVMPVQGLIYMDGYD